MNQICINKVCFEFSIYYFIYLIILIILGNYIIDFFRTPKEKIKEPDDKFKFLQKQTAVYREKSKKPYIFGQKTPSRLLARKYDASEDIAHATLETPCSMFWRKEKKQQKKSDDDDARYK